VPVIGKGNLFGHTLHILGTVEEPLWHAKEVCEIVGIRQHTDALKRLDDDEKVSGIAGHLWHNQPVILVTESGLYSLILRSSKPEAKVFKRWITHEVLPSLRKHGQFPPPSASELEILTAVPAELMDWAPKEDAEFELESVSRRILISERLRACAEIESAPHLSLKKACTRISRSYVGRNRGWSWISVYRFHRMWQQGGRRWQCLRPKFELRGRRKRLPKAGLPLPTQEAGV